MGHKFNQEGIIQRLVDATSGRLAAIAIMQFSFLCSFSGQSRKPAVLTTRQAHEPKTLCIHCLCVYVSPTPTWMECLCLPHKPTHSSGSAKNGTDTNQRHLITRPKCSCSQLTVHHREQGSLSLIIHLYNSASSVSSVANSNNCHNPVASQKYDQAPQDKAYHTTCGPNSPAQPTHSIAW